MDRNFVKLSFKQLCVRRWIEVATSPVFYGLIFAFISVGAVIGPYGMRESLSFSERLLFSLQTNIVLWTIGIIVAVPVRIGIQQFHSGKTLSLLVGCLAAGLAVTPVLDFLLQRQLGEQFVFSDYVEYSVLFFVLASIIAYVTVQMSRQSAGGVVPDSDIPDDVETAPDWRDSTLLTKLPHNKRGKLIALIAQDHYVEVITEKGAELLLMRLSDAIEEANGQDGLRVHRSVWVAADAVRSVRREKRRTFAVLTNGQTIPVARVNEPLLHAMLKEQVEASNLRVA